MVDQLVDSRSGILLTRLDYSVSEMNDLSGVVSAWSCACPLCTEGRAVFMVHANGDVTLRCPDCDEKASLNEYQEWQESLQG